MDLLAIKELIPFLRENSVLTFKLKDLEISFAPNVGAQDPKEIFDAIKKTEDSLPPDLRTDSAHDFDKVLTWSTGGGDLPLTGDEPL